MSSESAGLERAALAMLRTLGAGKSFLAGAATGYGE